MKLSFNKKEILDTIVLYASTLAITMGLVYLFFPNLIKGLVEVNKINKNVVTIHEKLDSMAVNDQYHNETTNAMLEDQYIGNSMVLDSLANLNKKIDNIQRGVYYINRISVQNYNDLQKVKQMHYNNQFSSPSKINYQPKSPAQVLDSIFKRD